MYTSLTSAIAVGHSQLLARWPSMLWQISWMILQSTRQATFARLLKTHFFS